LLITTSVQAAPVVASTPIRVRALPILCLTWAASRAPTRTPAAGDALMPTSVVPPVPLLTWAASRALTRTPAADVLRSPTSAVAVAVAVRLPTSPLAPVLRSRILAAAVIRKLPADVLRRAMAATAAMGATVIGPRVTANG
jgi:hypothetical protein